jgi:4-amino-4-deoxy-L-arabinose transferase-like glycosyltransferase
LDAGIAPIMTSLAATLHTSALPARLVAAWNAAATRWNPIAVITVAWAVLAVPRVFFRGYTAHEGLAVSIARTALETGDWLTPHLYNVRFVERPTLQSWIIEAISAPFGDVNQIAARLPSVLFLLFGCGLIYALLRRVSASVPAALLGVALFLACPLVMRSYVMVTADLPLAVLLFFAFMLWWDGYARESVSVSRWLVIGVVLALAGLLKGPQPIGYFVLGVGVFIVGTRSWRQIPGLALAGLICAVPLVLWYASIYTPGDEATWRAFMRLGPGHEDFPGPIVAGFRVIVDTLPATLLAAAFLVAYGFREKRFVRPQFMAALACYAFVAAVLILFWPSGSTPRYYLPMVLPLCVFGGLGYDQLSVRRPQLVAPILVVTAVLLIYAMAYSLASPLLPQRFRQGAVEGAEVTTLIEAAPGPIYWSGDVALNLLPYLPRPIAYGSLEELAAVPGPAWMIMTTADAETLVARHPGKLHIVRPLGETQQWRLVRLDP